jgi:fatty acid amide hydrolase 2
MNLQLFIRSRLFIILRLCFQLFKGLPNTSGLLVRRGVRSERDSDAIALMRKAGAIPLAVTNVSELCMWCESSNFIYGCTRNAYHQGRMVGGSSGSSTIGLTA